MSCNNCGKKRAAFFISFGKCKLFHNNNNNFNCIIANRAIILVHSFVNC
jgi:hypothetical protein